jgi:hypothetical protein
MKIMFRAAFFAIATMTGVQATLAADDSTWIDFGCGSFETTAYNQETRA